MDDLDLYYAHANEELYRLMEELGPNRTVGWEGKWEPRRKGRPAGDERVASLPVVFRVRVGNIVGGGTRGSISRMSIQSSAGGALKANLTSGHGIRIKDDQEGRMIIAM